mmetsp:Transcript_13951/g.21409  ORF Transcript_13951/g.21409 Transcript_13951/m.21409 type:complete len:167 (+) Transcript_13951:241-741(+)
MDYPSTKRNEAKTQSDAVADPIVFPRLSNPADDVGRHDSAAQVESGDLFDTETEIVPVLDALVGTVLRISLGEVREERELAAIRKKRREFEMLRDMELAELKALRDDAKERFVERQCRIRQEQQLYAVLLELKRTAGAREYAGEFFDGVVCSNVTARRQRGVGARG